MGGFSANNLRYCKSFFLFYFSNISIHAQVVRKLETFENQTDQLWEQVVPQLDTKGLNEENLSSKLIKIPWEHHILILKK
jgi:hypothetical protein